MKKYLWNKTESELIHDELFVNTVEYKYYTFGVAQGMYFIYKTLNEYNKKNISLTNAELVQVQTKNLMVILLECLKI